MAPKELFFVLTDRDYRAGFEASPDATLVVDSEGVIRDLNPQGLSESDT